MANLPICVLSLPAEEQTNPYFHLLYAGLAQAPYTHLQKAASFSQALTGLFRGRHQLLIHVHWFHCQHCFKFILFLLGLLIVRLLFRRRCAIFFTPHNVMQHNVKKAYLTEYFLRKLLLQRTDVVLCHCEREIKLLRRFFRLKNTHQFQVLAHPLYPATVEHDPSKVEQFFTEHTIPRRYILSFGQIAPYKGLEQVLSAWQQVENKQDTVLLIAGKIRPDQSDYHARLQQQLAHTDAVQFLNMFVPSAALDRLIQQALATVFCYRRITSSGAVLLSLSHQQWCIVPKKGCLAALNSDSLLKYRGQAELTARLEQVLTKTHRPNNLPLAQQATVQQVQAQLYHAYETAF